MAVWVFQKRMQRSAVPPPEARSPFWCGDHASALTAAVWSEKRSSGEVPCGDLRVGREEARGGEGGLGGRGREVRGVHQMKSLLSFPPDAS